MFNHLFNNIKGDIEILITGLRPGEKLFEELLIEDNSLPTKHPKIFKAQDNFISWDKLINDIDSLEKFIYKNDIKNIISILTKFRISVDVWYTSVVFGPKCPQLLC